MLQAAIKNKNEKSAKDVAQIESARSGMLASLGLISENSLRNDYRAATEQMVAKMHGDIYAL